jgi:acetyltransferase-like isoleucine patch superfamily enzyme
MQRLLQLIGPLPFIALAIAAAGLSAGVALWFFDQVLMPWVVTTAAGTVWRYPLSGLALALGYFAYGMTLLVVAPTLNFLLLGQLRPYRGSAVSLTAMRWYVHCTLTLVVRYTFLEFVTPSPFAQAYYRLMGMRIGRNVTINSTAIADPSLICMDDGVTIGGSASVMAHYAQAGYLVIAPVRLRAGATIGLRAIIMGGVDVGEQAKVLAGSFVLPNTVIPAGEIWAGIPARRIERESTARETMPDLVSE